LNDDVVSSGVQRAGACEPSSDRGGRREVHRDGGMNESNIYRVRIYSNRDPDAVDGVAGAIRDGLVGAHALQQSGGVCGAFYERLNDVQHTVRGTCCGSAKCASGADNDVAGSRPRVA